MASVHICIISWCKRGGLTHKATYMPWQSQQEKAELFLLIKKGKDMVKDFYINNKMYNVCGFARTA